MLTSLAAHLDTRWLLAMCVTLPTISGLRCWVCLHDACHIDPIDSNKAYTKVCDSGQACQVSDRTANVSSLAAVDVVFPIFIHYFPHSLYHQRYICLPPAPPPPSLPPPPPPPHPPPPHHHHHRDLHHASWSFLVVIIIITYYRR